VSSAAEERGPRGFELALASLAIGAAIAAGLVGCSTGEGPETGIGEPIQVSGGQFVPGPMPGYPPPDGGVLVDFDSGIPTILNIQAASSFATPGLAAKSFSGDVVGGAVAVGVRLADMGTGYWVVPVGAPDTTMPGAYGYSLSAAFDLGDPPGLHTLQFVGIAQQGNGGPEADLAVCIQSRVPDNGHACNPAIAPPHAVFTLQWDTNFDLDLHVIAPSGLDFNPKNPLGEPLEAGVSRVPADAPFIDRDSMRNCVADGLRQEDLVFPDSLPSGRYHIYVDPFANCGQNQVHFKFTAYKSSGTCPNCNLGVVSGPLGGELLASQVTAGTAPATFIEDIVVQ
jgi:hypothetical protein